MFSNTTPTKSLPFRPTNRAAKLNGNPALLRNSDVEKPQNLNVTESDFLKSRAFQVSVDEAI